MTMPAVGDDAPLFELSDATGSVSLADLRGQNVVIYFYPQAFTGGCTTEACGLRDRHPAIQASNAVVLGLSVDDLDTLTRFRAEYELPFRVLSDPDGGVARRYGVFGIERADGSTLDQARRATFIVDPAGKIAAVFDPVDPVAHAGQVEEALARLST